MTAQTLYMHLNAKKCAFGGSNYTFFSLSNQFEAHYVDQKVNMCWPNFEIFERMYNYNQISIYSFWIGLELAKTHIYMKNDQNLLTCTKMTPQLGFSLHIYIRATSQAPKRQARRGSQLVLMNLLTFLFQNFIKGSRIFLLRSSWVTKG